MRTGSSWQARCEEEYSDLAAVALFPSVRGGDRVRFAALRDERDEIEEEHFGFAHRGLVGTEVASDRLQQVLQPFGRDFLFFGVHKRMVASASSHRGCGGVDIENLWHQTEEMTKVTLNGWTADRLGASRTTSRTLLRVEEAKT